MMMCNCRLCIDACAYGAGDMWRSTTMMSSCCNGEDEASSTEAAGSGQRLAVALNAMLRGYVRLMVSIVSAGIAKCRALRKEWLSV